MGKEGSLRIIRNGIGIHEHASIDLAGIKGACIISINKLVLKVSYKYQPTGINLTGEVYMIIQDGGSC